MENPEPTAHHGHPYLDEMNFALVGWRDPAARLHDALHKDELRLFCQPILTLASGETGIAEVFVRLREEEAALLPPGYFLPVFEHFRMMPDLDRWVVRHAADHLGAGSRITRLSINVSGQTLSDQAFPAFVAAELGRTGVAPAALLFEIDESDVLRQPMVAERFAGAIKSAGCCVLIDSFARRSVSFTPLKTLHVDFVKIDGSIVRNIQKSSVALNKLGAVVRLGEAIGIGIIAECVEEPEILERLRALGVGYAQGYGIAEPHPIEELALQAG